MLYARLLDALRLAALLAISTPVAAQLVRGTVSDSASRRPIPGAVLQLLDADGVVRAQALSDQRGLFRVRITGGAVRLRALRIGFRPWLVELPAADPAVSGVAAALELRVVLQAIPTFLTPVRVVAAQCGRRSDQGSALALLEQARAGLLTTVVSRDVNPAALTRFATERTMDGTTDRVDRFLVRLDSTDRAGSSFSAVHDAAGFVRRGFMEERTGGQTYFAPDADVLLDDGFAAGYCFRVMPPDRERPHQVGLGFEAADRRRDRVDIDGALWIDTVANELRDIEFLYVGLDRSVTRFAPGGRLSFRAMSNGVVLVDRWSLNLIGLKADTVPSARLRTPRVNHTFFRHESGGELARADWPDGTSWRAPLGTLSGRATLRDGSAAAGIVLALPGTPYRATTDTAGRFTIADLVPGPYTLFVVDPALLTIDITLPTGVSVHSDRDERRIDLIVPTAAEFAIAACRDNKRYNPAVDHTFVIARALTPDGAPIEDVRWTVRVLRGSLWEDVAVNGRTGSNGLMPQCQDLRVGDEIDLEVTPPEQFGARRTVRRRLTGPVSVMPIVFEP